MRVKPGQTVIDPPAAPTARMRGRRPARSHRALLLLALTATVATAGGPDLPHPLVPYEAEYRVSRGPLTLGRSTTRLRPVARGWEYRTVVEATGIARLIVSGDAVERTVLEAWDGGLRPLLYHQRLPDDGGEARVRFDWLIGQALVDNEDGSLVLPLAEGTHDPHAAILRVMQALAAGDDPPSFGIIDDDGDFTRLHFERLGEQRIRVPLGEFDTIEVRRLREDGDRQLMAWFAPELDWLPVRIKQVEDGSTVARMDLRRLDDRGPAPAPGAGDQR